MRLHHAAVLTIKLLTLKFLTLTLLSPLSSAFPTHGSTPTLRKLCCVGECSTEGGLELKQRPRWTPAPVWTPRSDHSQRAQVQRLSGMLERLCNIILSADDVALGEREASKIGHIFMDARGNMTRSPVMLRQQTHDLMIEYGVEPIPLQRKWSLQRKCVETL